MRRARPRLSPERDGDGDGLPALDDAMQREMEENGRDEREGRATGGEVRELKEGRLG